MSSHVLQWQTVPTLRPSLLATPPVRHREAEAEAEATYAEPVLSVPAGAYLARVRELASNPDHLARAAKVRPSFKF